jgi:hypothetical protein
MDQHPHAWYEERGYGNGCIWKFPACNIAVVQWINNGQWGLLTLPYRAADGGTAMMFYGEEDGTLFTDRDGLVKRLEGCEFLRHLCLPEVSIGPDGLAFVVGRTKDGKIAAVTLPTPGEI